MKALLKRKNIEFEEIVLSTEEEIENFYKELDVTTLPQLIDNGQEIVGGFKAVINILRNKFDYELLHKVTKVITRNLNKVIDVNYYPTEKTKRSNLYHRPIGIGVQGLADAFIMMDIAFHSQDAITTNKNIFETIYHAALEQSMQLSFERKEDFTYLMDEYSLGNWNFKDDSDICTEYEIINRTEASSINVIINDGKTKELLEKIRPIRAEINLHERENDLRGAYSTFEGSPASEGILQFDMWEGSNVNEESGWESGLWKCFPCSWRSLKNNIIKYGLRNSLLVAPMPTASTSQILGNNECFEPLTSNIYSRGTLAGNFVLANKYLIKELLELGIWNENIKNNIILNKGSIQYIDCIPQFIKDKYKIVWEIPMKHLIDMARDRGAFICQSQSLNLWMEDPNPKSLTNMHFYGWKNGLKTGIYYLRRKPRHQPQQFTIEPKKMENSKTDIDIIDETEAEGMICTKEDGCIMCSG